MAGQKEYEVELQFTAGLLSSPDRTRTNEENIDGEKAIFGSKSDLQSRAGSSRLSFGSNGSIASSNVKVGETNNNNNNSEESSMNKEHPNILVDATAGSSGYSDSTTSVRKVYNYLLLFFYNGPLHRISFHPVVEIISKQDTSNFLMFLLVTFVKEEYVDL